MRLAKVSETVPITCPLIKSFPLEIFGMNIPAVGALNHFLFSSSTEGSFEFSGISLESSFKLSILTLMNTVNSSMYGIDYFDFQELQFFTKYCLIIFMIIGRVELLTLLIICKKFLFKN